MKKAAIIIGTAILLCAAFCVWFYKIIAEVSDLTFEDYNYYL